jgi:hypothetical protein
MGMFDEADEITAVRSLHQFQTILNVMENQELVLKDEPNRLSFVKLSKMADFLGIRGRFHSEDEMDGNCTLIRRSSQMASAGGHQSIDYTTLWTRP